MGLINMIDFNKELITMLEITKELMYIYQVENKKNTLPKIISFEGLAGCGKSTQIDLVKNALDKKNIKVYTMELPGENGVSILLSSLYKNKKEWNELIKINPWTNTFFIAVDFKLMLEKIAEDGYEYVLMSRGLFSSIYYTIYNYKIAGASEDEAIENAINLCKIIKNPEVIIYLDIEIDEALKRIEIRNRLPKRESDTKECLEESLQIYNKLFEIYNEKFDIYKINAIDDRDRITDNILKIIERYIG